MFCKYCGREINDDSVFCKYCGRELIGNQGAYDKRQETDKSFTKENEKRNDPNEKVNTSYHYNAEPNKAAAEDITKHNTSKKSKLAIVAFLAIIIIIVGFAKFYDNTAGESSSNTKVTAPPETVETSNESAKLLSDTDAFIDFMEGSWKTDFSTNYFTVSIEDGEYYTETDLPIEGDTEYSWYVEDAVYYICYGDDDEGTAYLKFLIQDDNTVTIYSYQENNNRTFHRQ